MKSLLLLLTLGSVLMMATTPRLTAQPEIDIDPTEFSFTMNHGLHEGGILDVFNDGDSTLYISANVVVPRRDEDLDILIWTAYADAEWELANVLRSLELLTNDYTLTYYDGTDADEIAEYLGDVHVFLIPEQENANERLLEDIGDALWEDLNTFASERGGIIVANDVSGTIFGFLREAGLLNLEIVQSGLRMTCEQGEQHVLNVGLNEFTALNGSNYHTADNDDAIAITQPVDYEGNHTTARKIGRGGVVYIGSDWWQYNSEMSRLLVNAVSWSRGNWLVLEQFTSEILPNDSEGLFFNVDSRSTPGPGNYSLEILLTTNDPDNQALRVPVNLRVTPWQPANLTLDPAEIFIVSQAEQDCTIVVLVENTGGGLLEVEISLYRGDPWLSINRESMSIDPGLMDRIVVTIDPSDAEEDMVSDFIQFRYSNVQDTLVELPVYFYKGDEFGTIEGTAYDVSNDEGVENVEVNIYGMRTQTDADGKFEYPTLPPYRYQVIFDHPDFLPYTAHQIQVLANSTSYANAPLAYCTFETDLERYIEVKARPDEITYLRGRFGNDGTGDLNYNSRFIDLSIEDRFADWEERYTLPTGEITDRNSVLGAAFDGEHLYFTAQSNLRSSRAIFKVSRDGEVVDTLAQPGWTGHGMADLAWDGELLWGSSWGAIYGFDSDGEPVDSIQNDKYYYSRALAYDPEADLFWIANAASPIIAVNRNDEIVYDIENSNLLQIYGLAWMPDDPDGFPLYAFCRSGPSNAQLNKIDIETGDVYYIRDIPTTGNEVAGGCEITYDWDRRHWTILLQFINSGNRTTLYNLKSLDNWVSLDPASDIVRPNRDQNIVLTFNSDGMHFDEFLEGYFLIDGRQRGGTDTIWTSLVVEPNAVVSQGTNLLPEGIHLDVYPNPFNSMLSVNYYVPMGTRYKLKLYDITGRLIDVMAADLSTGSQYSLRWDMSTMSSGIYIIRLETAKNTSVRKALLIK